MKKRLSPSLYSEPDNSETLFAISSTDHHEGARLRKQPTFGEGKPVVEFPNVGCFLGLLGSLSSDDYEASENVDKKK